MSNLGLTLVTGDANYATLHDFWVKQGRPSTVEVLAQGFQYRAMFPDPTDPNPTFGLIASSPTIDADLAGPPGGYAGAMSTFQSSLPRGQRDLPRD